MEAAGNDLALANRKENPWELAKTRFVYNLEPSERQLYDNATLENIYYATSNSDRSDAESSRTRTVIRKLGPLVSAIQSYGTAMDQFAQIAPLVVLVAAEAHSKFYAKIVDILARIGDIVPRFRDYERIYKPQKHQRLVQALSNAYLDIIILCTQFRKSIRDHQSSKVRRIFKPLSFNQQFDDAIEKFRRHKQSVGEEANTCYMIEAAEEREARLTLFAAARRRRLLSRLSSVNCGHRHRRLQGTRHGGTGMWLPQHPEYIKWEALGTGPAVLCCYGIRIAGCGKSVLASTVIDAMAKDKGAIFYYCDFTDKRTLFPSNLFGTLARQILEKSESIPEPLATAIEQADHDGDRISNHSKALEILEQCIKTSSHSLCIILDGLDEATESAQRIICDGLRHIIHREGSTTKLCITARAEVDALLRLRPSIPMLHIPMSRSAIALDIESYVRASTKRRISDSSLVIRDPSLEELIVSELVNGAEGMFLWVEFQLNELCNAESDHAIKRVLDNLPRSLSETYDRLLSRIEGLERTTMIKRMFKWIVCARQPLHVDELREGVVFTLDDFEWEQDKVITDFSRLVRSCSNLVMVDTETQVVQLAHYTVEQYLLQVETTRFHFTREEADIMVGDFCLAYLSFANFETRVTVYKENTNTDLVTLSKLASRAPLVASDHPRHTAIKLWNTLRSPNIRPMDLNMTQFVGKRPKEQDLSQFSCLPYVIRHWLRHSASFPSVTQAAANSDSQRRLRLLRDLVLEKDLPFQFRPWADCLPSDDAHLHQALFGWGLMENHSVLIHFAGQSVWDDIMEGWEQFCMKYGPHTEFPDDSIQVSSESSYAQGTPVSSWLFSRLLLACRQGHTEAIKACMPLHSTANVELAAYFVVVAAIHGHLSLVEELWPHGTGNASCAKVEKDGFFLNALEHAISSRHTQIVPYLRDIGQKVEVFNDEEGFFRSLEDAIDRRNPDGVALLFIIWSFCKEETALDSISTYQCSRSRVLSTLNRAAEGGCHSIVEFMLRNGVDPDAFDESCVPPLFHAISRSDVATVKVLIDYATSTAVTPFGLPLTLAACIGDLDVINLLLSTNTNMTPNVMEAGVLSGIAYASETLSGNPDIYLSPTPLYMACYHGRLEVVKLLVAKGESPYAISPKSSIKVSRENGGVVCKIRPYRLFFNDPAGPFEGADLSQYQLWKTPLDTAITRGHENIAVFLKEHAKGVTDSNNSQLEITNSGLGQIRLENPMAPYSYVQRAILRLLNQDHLDSSTLLEFLVATGASLQKTKFEGRSIILWALENKPSLFAWAIPRGTAYEKKLLLHAFTELVALDGHLPPRIFGLFSVIERFGGDLLEDVLSSAFQERAAVIKDVLFDTFAYIISRVYLSPESVRVLNAIIRAVLPIPLKKQAGLTILTTYVLRILKRECGNTGVPKNVALLRDLFETFSSESCWYRGLAFFVAIKHENDNLVKALYDDPSSGAYLGPETPPLIFAVEHKAPMSIIDFLLEQEGTRGHCCDTDKLGETALDKAINTNYTEAVDLIKSWHGMTEPFVDTNIPQGK